MGNGKHTGTPAANAASRKSEITPGSQRGGRDATGRSQERPANPRCGKRALSGSLCRLAEQLAKTKMRAVANATHGRATNSNRLSDPDDYRIWLDEVTRQGGLAMRRLLLAAVVLCASVVRANADNGGSESIVDFGPPIDLQQPRDDAVFNDVLEPVGFYRGGNSARRWRAPTRCRMAAARPCGLRSTPTAWAPGSSTPWHG